MISVTTQNIQKLHKKYSINGPFRTVFTDIIWTHSLIIADIALQIAKNLTNKYKIKIDIKLMKTGDLLHDIGVYQIFDEKLHLTKDYIQHGILGYKILKSEGYSEQLAGFALCHTGVGLTRENIHINKIPLPDEDLIPLTLEEEIICYADNFHTKTPSFCEYKDICINLEKDYHGNISRLDYMENKFGIPNLTKIKQKYNSWHKKIWALRNKYAL